MMIIATVDKRISRILAENAEEGRKEFASGLRGAIRRVLPKERT